MVAVTIATRIMPDNIIKIAKILPGIVTGAISPYPTVVIVTIDHHKEFLIFLKAPGSIIEIKIEPIIQINRILKMTFKK